MYDFRSTSSKRCWCNCLTDAIFVRNIRYGVIVGKGLRSRLNFQEKRIGVRRVFIPPGFKDGLYENDVAMLLVSKISEKNTVGRDC